MATIHKRRLVSGNVVWELTHGAGRDRQRFVAGRTREEAQEVLKQFERQLALHGEAPSGDDLESALGLYRTFLTTNRRYGTQRRYLRVLRTFHRCYLEVHHPQIRSLRQLRPVHLEDYKRRRLDGEIVEAPDREWLQREDALRNDAERRPKAPSRRDNAKFGWLGRKRLRARIAPRTINYELQVLRTYFRWAITRNMLVINPASTVERLRIPKRALPKFLTSEDLTKLFEACAPAERRLFMTILLSGMRKGEAMHLTWSDVDVDAGVIVIQAKPQWDWKPKTDERVIPISPALREVLDEQYVARTSDELVFPNKEGHRDTHMLAKLQKAARKAGVPRATVHALRHSFGAHLRMAGVSLADIADLLGHKDLATTQIYAKVQQEHLRTAVAKLRALTNATSTPVPQSPAKSSES